MSSTLLERVRTDLVIANRILAHEQIIDAYGHVSVRHPDDPGLFLLSRSRSPEHVQESDLLTHDLGGDVVDGDRRPPYLERFIHASIYAARPDVHSVVHAHTESVLPFTVTDVPLLPLVHDVGDIGLHVPVWEIRDRFGDQTNLLVSEAAMGDDLAARLGQERVVLMRGHGFAAAGPALSTTVRMCVFLDRNAKVQTIARTFGDPVVLSEGEVAARRAFDPDSPAMRRSWEYWARRAGCADLL